MKDVRNRWERLRELPPADEAQLHFESADDPLGEDIICDGCKDDWPCDFERGRRSGGGGVNEPVDVFLLAESVRQWYVEGHDERPVPWWVAERYADLASRYLVHAKARVPLAEPKP